MDNYLYQTLEVLEKAGMLKDVPSFINNGLSKNIILRDYQERAFKYFITYFENENLHKNKQIHTLFHMATGSGKTIIMAGLILYLYTKGYRKFLFFVNQTNIIEKTKDNFINSVSNKYLFNKKIEYAGDRIKIRLVNNFSDKELENEIQICFTTTQKLHFDLLMSKENSLTYRDFEDSKIVFISDESHHINTATKKESKEEEMNRASWEYSVMNAFSQNKESIMLEFTATADLRDRNIEAKYKDKIIFDYRLKNFRESGFTKDFQNFATESELWDRTLMALVLSEYRRFLFNDNKLNIKPVILLKSQRITESKEFYDLFFKKIDTLEKENIKELYKANIDVLTKALDYFKRKDDSFELLVQSLKSSFTKEKSVIMNEKSDNNKENQLLVNSLEDEDNKIRIIFTVDMLNEGWDVLNLFDIVRLYDTRQGSGRAGKIGNYTIKEAQLIGRGARYCPFIIDEEQEKYKRKYDNDLNNELRILETMYYHSRNDSRYISELRQALIQSGLQDSEPIKREYKIKESFKDTDFYKKAYVFHNKRVQKDRNDITEIEDKFKTKVYYYKIKNNQGRIYSIIDEDENIVQPISTEKVKKIKFKDIEYNILEGASERYSELQFSSIKSKYPNVSSLKEFLTNDDYLGNSEIEISYIDEITGKDIRNACIKSLQYIANHIIEIKQEYEGTKEFEPISLREVLKDKSIYLSKLGENGGKGHSQIDCINEEYRLDLSKEDWYVYNDNYGTSEEKLFIKFFKNYVVPKLIEKKLEFYLVRNERIPDLAIYSFENGKRFEPDFLLFVKKQNKNSPISQVYAEPKGNNLLEEDKWKEDFMKQISTNAKTNPMFNYENEYKIMGLPFYNEEYRKTEFEEAINKWIEQL